MWAHNLSAPRVVGINRISPQIFGGTFHQKSAWGRMLSCNMKKQDCDRSTPRKV